MVAGTNQQKLKERTGAGDYLGCRCQACGQGEYGLPWAPAGTDPEEARRILGDGLERDPEDASWIVLGVVWCPVCNDRRPRWIKDEEVHELRRAERVGFIKTTARQLYDKLAAETKAEGMLEVLGRALEENWGPMAEVIDRVAALDEHFGTPIWGHPYWTTMLAQVLGECSADVGPLPHPGNEFVSRPIGMMEMVEAEPPAKGTEELRSRVISLAAMAIRWIIAIELRQEKEDKEESDADVAIQSMVDDVRRWLEMTKGTLIPGDEDERAAIERLGQKHWLGLSISMHPKAKAGLDSIGIEVATPDEVERLTKAVVPEAVAGKEEDPRDAQIELLEGKIERMAHAVASLNGENRRLKAVVETLEQELDEIVKQAIEPHRDAQGGPVPAPPQTKPKTGKAAKRAKKKAHKNEAKAAGAEAEPDAG